MRRKGRLGFTLAVLSLLTFGVAAPPLLASSFQVDPVTITLAPGRQSTSLTLRNTDKVPVSVRVLAFRWTQENGADVYTPTSDVIVSPPIFTVAAGSTQLIRVGLAKPRGTAAAAYRIMIEEIPRQQASGSQIQVALRLNLPLYVLAPGNNKPLLSWSAWFDSAGELHIQGRNQGALHAQILGFAAVRPAGAPTILSQQMGVILPGSAREWRIGKRTDVRAGVPMLLKVRTPLGETQEQVLVEQR